MGEYSGDDSPERAQRIAPTVAAAPADDSPAPAGPASLPMNARPWQEPDRLILGVPLGKAAPIIIGTLIALGVVTLPFVLLLGQGIFRPRLLVWMLVMPALFAPWAVWYILRLVVLPRVTLDRGTDMLILGWRGVRGRRPLASVLGVQVMQTRKRYGRPEFNMAAITLYQMNLILDDPVQPRLNVLNCDAGNARSTARTVADFLGVPVLDNAGAQPILAMGAKAVPTATGGTSAIASPVAVEPKPDLLLIRSRRFSGPMGRQWKTLTPIVLILALMVVPGAGAIDGVTAALVAMLAFFALALVLPLILVPCARFDRRRGELVMGRPGRWAPPRPLESVKAVEVADGSECALNLLLDDPAQPRLTVAADADGALVRRAAERLATFLNVPLQAANRPTPTAAPDFGEKAVHPLEALSRGPLPPGAATIQGSPRLAVKGPDAMVLTRRLGLTWLQLIPTVLVAASELSLVWYFLFAPMAMRAQLSASALIVALFGVMAHLAMFRKLFLYRDHFDRRAGLLKMGWFSLKGAYPLVQIRAVQLIPSGLVARSAASFGRGAERVAYQMNLVTADAYRERLNLTDDTDLKGTRLMGRRIADFLEVPLIDQIAEDD